MAKIKTEYIAITYNGKLVNKRDLTGGKGLFAPAIFHVPHKKLEKFTKKYGPIDPKFDVMDVWLEDGIDQKLMRPGVLYRLSESFYFDKYLSCPAHKESYVMDGDRPFVKDLHRVSADPADLAYELTFTRRDGE